MNYKCPMKRIAQVLLLCLCLFGGLTARAFNISVTVTGAKGDGKALDHLAINRAIDSCVARGGGRVTLPAGRYLCGSVRLKSNVELHLDPGAKIIAAPASMKAYDESEPFEGEEYQDGGHTYFHNSLLWADGESNVSITGQGMIDGSGLTRKDTEKGGRVQGGSIGTGDKAIALKNCRDVTIRDVTIYRGGHFGIIVTGCELVTIDNVIVDTNRDGIDIDCCKFVTVSNSKINTPHDDALVLKSSYALKRAVPCEQVLINNCVVTGYKLGTLLDGTHQPEKVNWVCGRIKLGTESNGGFRNINISNCTCLWSSGLAFEEVDQGRMENITVNNITMEHVHHYPIYITTGSRNRGPKECTAVSYGENINISNVVATDVDSLAGIIVTGLPGEPLRNISLHNIHIQYRGGGTREQAQAAYPEQGKRYPEPKFSGPTPAYGLFARHVDGLSVHHLTFETQRPDFRPAVMLEDVVNDDLQDVKGPVQKGVQLIQRKEQQNN
jgi:polygalacturonase